MEILDTERNLVGLEDSDLKPRKSLAAWLNLALLWLLVLLPMAWGISQAWQEAQAFLF